MPVPYPGSYNTLIEAARNSKISVIHLEAICPRNNCPPGSLRLTSWLVKRHAVDFSEGQVAQYRAAPVPLAICESCGHRVRVLPVELLPYKVFSLAIIEESCRRYLDGPGGLRKAVEQIEGAAPHYSTLHGWLGGLGERALDRVSLQDVEAAPTRGALVPTSAIIAETARRYDPELGSRWTQIHPEIDPSKYQSEFRRERLEACLKLILVADCLFIQAPFPLIKWEHFLVSCFHVPGWRFRSRSSLTAFQLDNPAGNRVASGGKEAFVQKTLVRIRSP